MNVLNAVSFFVRQAKRANLIVRVCTDARGSCASLALVVLRVILA